MTVPMKTVWILNEDITFSYELKSQVLSLAKKAGHFPKVFVFHDFSEFEKSTSDLKQYFSKKPDLLLCDDTLGTQDMVALSLSPWMKENGFSDRVIFVTAISYGHYQSHFKDVTPSPFVLKGHINTDLEKVLGPFLQKEVKKDWGLNIKRRRSLVKLMKEILDHYYSPDINEEWASQIIQLFEQYQAIKVNSPVLDKRMEKVFTLAARKKVAFTRLRQECREVIVEMEKILEELEKGVKP